MLDTVRAESVTEIVLTSEIEFQPLNPLRGDASPRAGALWGDIRKDVPSGALTVFAEGFSSPPHIHNITYRGIVISGAIHNDDPSAESLWMGPGSYWTQPAGEPHITAAAPGSGGAVAFLEIQAGPYLVQPSGEAFDNGERPVNVEARNVVWLNATDVTWIKHSDAPLSAKMAFLWGDTHEGQKNGTLLSLPPGYSGKLRGNGSWIRAVMILGRASHRLSSESDLKNLDPGSYFGSKGGVAHEIACQAQDNCLIYVSTEGRYEFTQL